MSGTQELPSDTAVNEDGPAHESGAEPPDNAVSPKPERFAAASASPDNAVIAAGPGETYSGPFVVVDGVPKPLTPQQAATLAVVPDEPPPSYVLRSLAWTDRLTMAELGGITLAASRGLEVGDPTLQVFLDTLGRATEVNVQDPRFVGALDAFAQAGLLDAERLPELLAPAAPGEAPS